VLAQKRNGQPPAIELDAHYKLLPEFDGAFGTNVPSLVHCDELKVSGKMRFSPDVVCRGKVEFVNASTEPRTLASGQYVDARVEL
jgi:hypothetical protein